MEAKDTVKTSNELCVLVYQEMRDLTLKAKDCKICQLTKQADISFKAGVKEAVEWITQMHSIHR